MPGAPILRAMIRITVSVAAYTALATAFPSGLGVQQERAPNGDYYVWLDRRFVDRLRAMREFLCVARRHAS